MVDAMLVNAANDLKTAGYDPAVLPDSSTSWRVVFVTITARLEDGTFVGLSNITRNGDTTFNTSTNSFMISGNLRMSQSKGFLTASASGGGISASADVEVTVDHVDMLYEIETCVSCMRTLTNFEITDVGTIDVDINGLGVLGNKLSKVVTLASNLISDYIAGTFEDEVQVAIQNYLTNLGPFEL